MSTSSLSFCEAQRGDVNAIAQLLTQLNAVEAYPQPADALRLAEGLFNEPREVKLRSLLARRRNKTVGVALYYRGYDVQTYAYGYHLADLVVEEKQRRKQIGRQLFAALAEQNLREGGEWISLTVLSANHAARAFYRSLGMIQVSVDFFAANKRILQSHADLLQN